MSTFTTLCPNWLEYQPTRRSDEGEQDGEVSKDSICVVESGLNVLEVDLGVLQRTGNIQAVQGLGLSCSKIKLR